MNCVIRKRILGFPTRSDTNQAVQQQEMARSWKFQYGVKISGPLFSHMQKSGFLMTWLKLYAPELWKLWHIFPIMLTSQRSFSLNILISTVYEKGKVIYCTLHKETLCFALVLWSMCYATQWLYRKSHNLVVKKTSQLRLLVKMEDNSASFKGLISVCT